MAKKKDVFSIKRALKTIKENRRKIDSGADQWVNSNYSYLNKREKNGKK